MTGETEITWPLEHTFGKRVTALGDEYAGLTLREPTCADLLKSGVLDGDLDGEKMIEMIASLSGKPTPVIKALPGAEILRLSTKLSRFFSQAASAT